MPACFEKKPQKEDSWNDASVFWKKSTKKRIPDAMPACFEKSQKEDSWNDASMFWIKSQKEDS